jgi:FAD/FMN-containing dehydrogenase
MTRPLVAADAAFVARLAEALGPDSVRPPEARYLEEPRGRFPGHAAAVVRPASTDAVAAAVRLCAAARVGVVPYAGGTGLVGGQTLG